MKAAKLALNKVNESSDDVSNNMNVPFKTDKVGPIQNELINLKAESTDLKNKLELTGSCWFEDYGYGDICLCYIEHATDHWNSDSETTVDIDKEKAEKIIGWLQDKFNVR